MQEIKIDIIPMPAIRQVHSDRWANRPIVLKYRAYKTELQLRLQTNGFKECPEQIELLFEMPMPISWSLKKRIETLGLPHKSKPDLDNLVKAILDSWGCNDSHCWNIAARKVWSKAGGVTIRSCLLS